MSGSGERDRREDGRPEQARPRDRTGRPLPYGTANVALIETVDPETVEEALALGVERWNACRYFEAHELLEHAWKRAPDADRDLWKGIIQLAVAGVHLQRGNPRGASRLLDRAMQRLARQPATHRGVAVEALLEIARRASTQLAAGVVPTADWGAFPTIGDGSASGVWFAATEDATGPSAHPTPLAP